MSVHSDRALRESVRECLMKDTRLAGQPITIRVNRGYVTLVGIVDGEESKQIALQLARGIAGVMGEIEDRLEVR